MSKETFDFSEALRRMRQEKWVKRKNAHCHYALEHYKSDNHDIIICRFDDEEDAAGICAMYAPDILATDWEEVEE